MWNRILYVLFSLGISAFAQNSAAENRLDETNFLAARTMPEGVDPFDTEGNTQTNGDGRSVRERRYDRQAPGVDYTYESPCCYTRYSPFKSHVEIGGNYTYLNLKQERHDDAISGNLGGLQASYEYQPIHRIYQGVTFLWRQGHLDGEGHDRDFFDIDTQARIGYTFGDRCGSWLVSAFTGLGYRHMGEELGSVDLNYNTFYIPVGFVSNWEFMDSWYVGANFQWRPQAYPTLKIDPLEGARWITECTLANFLVEIPLTYVFCSEDRFALVLKPFFEYWQDGETTAEALGISLDIEKNTYLFGGFMLNLRYSF